MTRNALTRAHDDPLWSGRLVEGSDGGWLDSEQTLEHLQSHLVAALNYVSFLKPAETHDEDFDGHGVLNGDTVNVETLARLYEAVDNLQRVLPWAMGWCCGYYINVGVPKPYFVVRSAHESRMDAFRWLSEWQQKESHLFSVIRHPAPIIQFRHPDADPAYFIPYEIG